MASKKLAPLGVPLGIEFDSAIDPTFLDAACRGWSATTERGANALRLRIELDRTLAAGDLRIVVRGNRLVLHGDRAYGSACADRGQALCLVGPEWLGSPERLRAEVLDPLVLFLLTRYQRVPLHAAAILRRGLAIILAGPSGSGKSSLALAAAAAGWTVMTEDTVYVQMAPVLKVWGWPGSVHLLPEDAPHASALSRVRNGKLKHVIGLPGQSPTPVSSHRVVVCLLKRGGGPVLSRLDPTLAISMMSTLEPGFDLLEDQIRQVSELLLRAGAWQLTLSAKPSEAIALLASRLADLEPTAVSRETL